MTAEKQGGSKLADEAKEATPAADEERVAAAPREVVERRRSLGVENKCERLDGVVGQIDWDQLGPQRAQCRQCLVVLSAVVALFLEIALDIADSHLL